jgi:glucosamine--fructose-6-phosphate aminotransferase (isomerizing)
MSGTVTGSRSSDSTVLGQIAAGPAMIRATLEGPAAEAARSIATVLLERGTRRVFVVGNGTSLWSSRWVAGWHRSLAAPSDPVLIPMSAAEFRHYRPRLAPTDALLAISASGEFRDVIASVEGLASVVPVVGVVQSADTSLGRLASHLVVAAGGPSPMPVMTRTFLSTATAGALVALGLTSDGAAADDGRKALARAADHAASAIEAASSSAPALATRLVGHEDILVVGGGAAALAAGEGALKLTEMALIHAEGVETWEAESGVATIMGPGRLVIAIHPEGAAASATRQLARNAVAWGATVVDVAPSTTPGSAGSLLVASATEEALAPLVAVPPIAILAWHVAVARGATPDDPAWIARYAAQGLRHVAGAR